MFHVHARLVLRHSVSEHIIGNDQNKAQLSVQGPGFAAEQDTQVPHSVIATVLHHQRDNHVFHADFAWKKLAGVAGTEKFHHALQNRDRFYACFLVNKMVTLGQDPLVGKLADCRVAFQAKLLLQLCNPCFLVNNNIQQRYSKSMRVCEEKK